MSFSPDTVNSLMLHEDYKLAGRELSPYNQQEDYLQPATETPLKIETATSRMSSLDNLPAIPEFGTVNSDDLLKGPFDFPFVPGPATDPAFAFSETGLEDPYSLVFSSSCPSLTPPSSPLMSQLPSDPLTYLGELDDIPLVPSAAAVKNNGTNSNNGFALPPQQQRSHRHQRSSSFLSDLDIPVKKESYVYPDVNPCVNFALDNTLNNSLDSYGQSLLQPSTEPKKVPAEAEVVGNVQTKCANLYEQPALPVTSSYLSFSNTLNTTCDDANIGANLFAPTTDSASRRPSGSSSPSSLSSLECDVFSTAYPTSLDVSNNYDSSTAPFLYSQQSLPNSTLPFSAPIQPSPPLTQTVSPIETIRTTVPSPSFAGAQEPHAPYVMEQCCSTRLPLQTGVLPSYPKSHTADRPRKQSSRLCHIPPETMASLYTGPDEEGKYICLYKNCGKRVSRKYNIQSHIQTHLSDRPYRCTTCKASFVRQHDLKRHMRIHNGGKPFSCECGKSFNRMDALNRHKQRNICIGGFKQEQQQTVESHQEATQPQRIPNGDSVGSVQAFSLAA
ncbi:transcription factor Ace2 [Schizosaccharomyces japonicus yFS275]|uniref:Wilms tumor protein homolog n=1 Tax=Schizosaccharomyces japonicus (strain yFS275 / FY16936) TaxID=402676 RepID=B6K1Z0_SCHJY|nr:transcription factor Ace2 [Schizosaccharomyces japonicus yFS275]EEB07171.1 transcription factor Ace2 [Schizosaccharomyces japonicus yFS275]